MNLNELSISVRERSLAEIYDLSFLVCRRYWWQLGLLIFICYAPIAAFNYLFLFQNVHDSSRIMMFHYLIVFCEIPLITAAATTFLGNALFHGNTGIRYCLSQASKKFFCLFFYGVLKGTLIIAPAQMVEVYMLEQLKGSRAWKRGMRLMSGWRQDYLAQMMINSGLVVCSFILFNLLIHHAGELFMYSRNPFQLSTKVFEAVADSSPAFALHESIIGHLYLFPLIMYFTVVRFLSYINLRTVREGWSTELQIKIAAQRLFGNKQ